jgi:hypothetical protein
MDKCSVCSKETTKRCSRCKAVHYCSTECQTKDWENHNEKCKRFKYVQDVKKLMKLFKEYLPQIDADLIANIVGITKYLAFCRIFSADKNLGYAAKSEYDYVYKQNKDILKGEFFEYIIECHIWHYHYKQKGKELDGFKTFEYMNITIYNEMINDIFYSRLPEKYMKKMKRYCEYDIEYYGESLNKQIAFYELCKNDMPDNLFPHIPNNAYKEKSIKEQCISCKKPNLGKNIHIDDIWYCKKHIPKDEYDAKFDELSKKK